MLIPILLIVWLWACSFVWAIMAKDGNIFLNNNGATGGVFAPLAFGAILFIVGLIVVTRPF